MTLNNKENEPKQIDDEVIKVNGIESNQTEQIREIVLERKTGFNMIEVFVIIIIALLFGGLIGGFITYRRNQESYENIPTELRELIGAYNILTQNFYDKVDHAALVDAAIQGMVSSLDDPYTTFLDNSSTEQFQQRVDGEYVGIGASVFLMDNRPVIAALHENSPAENSELEVMDIIIKVDNVDVEGKALLDVTSMIMGEEGTSVELLVLRGEEELSIVIKRARIQIPSVLGEIIEENNQRVGYIAINVFAANTYEQFKEALEKLESDGIDSLILDVRGNPGGHLNQVTKILELFIENGDILYQIRRRGVVEDILSSSTRRTSRDYDIIVLQNQASASASEILAAAVKETLNGKIIGTVSFGKGNVQRAHSLSSGSSFKFTVEEWLTPNGNSINRVGVEPTIEVELNPEFRFVSTRENDNQLRKALDILTKE